MSVFKNIIESVQSKLFKSKYDRDLYDLNKLTFLEKREFIKNYSKITDLNKEVLNSFNFLYEKSFKVLQSKFIDKERNKLLQLFLMTCKDERLLSPQNIINPLVFLNVENMKRMNLSKSVLDEKNEEGKTFISYAMENGDFEKVKYLLSQNIYLSIILPYTYSDSKNKKIVEYMIKRKIFNKDNFNVDFLTLADKEAMSPVITSFLKKNDIYEKICIPALSEKLYFNSRKSKEYIDYLSRFKEAYFNLIDNGVSFNKKNNREQYAFIDFDKQGYKELFKKGLSRDFEIEPGVNLLMYFLNQKVDHIFYSDNRKIAENIAEKVNILCENGVKVPNNLSDKEVKELIEKMKIPESMKQEKAEILLSLFKNKTLDPKNYNLIINFPTGFFPELVQLIRNNDISVPLKYLSKFENELKEITFNHVILNNFSRVEESDIDLLLKSSFWNDNDKNRTSLFAYGVKNNNSTIIENCIANKRELRLADKDLNINSVYNLKMNEMGIKSEKIIENGKVTWVGTLNEENYTLLKNEGLINPISKDKYKVHNIQNYTESYAELLVKDNVLKASNIDYIFESRNKINVIDGPLKIIIDSLDIDLNNFVDEYGKNLLHYAKNMHEVKTLLNQGVIISGNMGDYDKDLHLLIKMAIPESIEYQKKQLREVVENIQIPIEPARKMSRI